MRVTAPAVRVLADRGSSAEGGSAGEGEKGKITDGLGLSGVCNPDVCEGGPPDTLLAAGGPGRAFAEVNELEDAIKNKKNTIHETADVIYHLLVTLESAGINFDDIMVELKKREGTSGFEEKSNR